MKPSSFLPCKFFTTALPVPDSRCDSSQMPFVSRSETHLTSNYPKSSKMLSTGLLRLNSIGENSPEMFPARSTGFHGLGFSKSFDAMPKPTSYSIKSRPGAMDENRSRSSAQLCKTSWIVEQPFSGQAFTSQFETHSYSQFQNSYYNRSRSNSFHQCQSSGHSGNNKSLQAYPLSPRIQEFLPSAMNPVMSVSQANSNILHQCMKSYGALITAQQQPQASVDLKLENGSDENMNTSGSRSQANQKEHEVASKSIESCVANLKLNDSLDLDLDLDKERDDSKEDSDIQKMQGKGHCMGNVSHVEKNLKRRNEKMEQITGSKESRGDNFNLCHVLFQRKAPKKGRPSCRKRKKRQHHRTSNSQSVEGQNITKSGSTFHHQPPSSVSNTDSSSNSMQSTVQSHHLPSPAKSSPLFVSSLVCSADSDSELSDNDFDSMELTCEYPNRLSLNSIDALFKPKHPPSLESLLQETVHTLSEQEHPPQSPDAIRFSFSVSVSEDEDSEFDSFSTLPTDQLYLEFGNCLSLENLFSRKAETVTDYCPVKSSQNEDDHALSPDREAFLAKINSDWDKHYPPLQLCSSLNDKSNVHFADDEDLVTAHVIGNEERRGTWYEDGQRFLKRIKDVEDALSPILSDSHRQKVFKKLELS